MICRDTTRKENKTTVSLRWFPMNEEEDDGENSVLWFRGILVKSNEVTVWH